MKRAGATTAKSALHDHPFFERWVDPRTGVESYILKEHVAPVQQSFYFTNPAISPDERWLWFYTGHPPAEHLGLGVVSLDAARPVIRHFPQAEFTVASPMVARDSQGAYFCAREAVWHVSLSGRVRKICELDQAFIAGRRLDALATHLTLSADGRYFLLDGEIGETTFIGLGDIRTGKVCILKEFGYRYNHAQFSPRDPSVFLLAQDWWRDHVSGRYFCYDHRIWLMNVQQTRFEPLCPTNWYGHGAKPSHEWWTADNRICWVDYEQGAFECDVASRRVTQVWPGPLCHAHCDSTRRYFCADQSPYEWKTKPCEVRFLDRRTRQQINIVSGLPRPRTLLRRYHPDPHPQFSPQGTYVSYTTTVRGSLDVAVTPVAGILRRMAAGAPTKTL